MISRRTFLSAAAALGVATAAPRRGLRSWFGEPYSLTAPLLATAAGETLLTVLHTNDTHSQIEPLAQDDRTYPNKGGVARRATLVKRIRKENPNTLLIDAGDVFQGTPYFNFFKGEVEYKAMSLMGYDAGTLGNHEFDNGVAALAAALKFANFDIVSANYDVHGTLLQDRVRQYVVKERAGIRIGLFGLGISPSNLITPDNFKGVTYLDPVEAARRTVKDLREKEQCALVIAMTHLGYYPNPKEGEIGDTQLAAQVDGIDFIAGGHSHTFMQQPVVQKQPSGGETVIFQVGKSGVFVGRVDFTLRERKITGWAGGLLNLRDDSLVETNG